MLKRMLCSVASAAVLALSSTTANAAILVTVPAPPVYTPPTSGIVGGQVAANTTNTDSFTFTLLGAAYFSGQLSTTALTPGGPGNLNFSNILLDGVPNLFTLITPDGAAETRACCTPNGNGAVFLNAGQHTLTYTVQNTSGVVGSYTGTFNFGAVPEPGTWAMMLLGFGAIGFAMRRQRQPVLAQIA